MKYVVINLMWTLLACYSDAASGQVGSWRVVTHGHSGPLAQTDLPDLNGKRRAVFIVMEYARSCDPLFSYVEIDGNSLGKPISQSLLKNSKIGVVLNGNFFTWHAMKTTYTNGFEASFGVENDVLLRLLTQTNSLAYVTPAGTKIDLPTGTFRKSLQTAIDHCITKIQ